MNFLVGSKRQFKIIPETLELHQIVRVQKYVCVVPDSCDASYREKHFPDVIADPFNLSKHLGLLTAASILTT